MGFSTTRRVLAAVVGLALFGVVPGAATAEVKTIRAVEVQDGDGSTRILLRGAENATYTAFVREDPPRLIVELPDAVFEGVSTPIPVDNGLVRDVTLGAFGDPKADHSMARVSIALAELADYEVVPEGDVIAIQLRPKSKTETTTAAAQPAPAAESAVEPGEQAEAAAAPAETQSETTSEQPAAAPDAEAHAAPAATPASKAHVSRIVGVSWQDGAVQVKADGAIDNHDSFVLANPDRIVVDFFGAKNAVRAHQMKWDGAAVRSARIGQHADKVRLVLDLAHPVASHEVRSSPGGVQILLGEAAPAATGEAPAETTAAAVPAAPAPEEAQTTEATSSSETRAPADEMPADMTAATPAAAAGDAQAEAKPAPVTGTAHVQSVHFESLPGTDRVVVTLDTERPAHAVEPDPQTVIVMFPATQIDPGTERRVDTREFRGTIEMFSIFKTPDVPQDEVRLVLKRSSPVSAKLHWDKTQLYVEMPRVESPASPADAALPGGNAPAAANAAPAGKAAAKGGAPASAAATKLTGDDPFLEGPADPAAIDILEEGGFDQEKQYQGRRISLDFKDADIANILRLIAEVSDLNVIAGEEVAGKVTIRLVDVPWDQALDVILLTKGLGFVRIGNILRIAPVDALKQEREARLQERRSREKLEDLVVKLQPVNFAKAKDLDKLVKRLLSSRGSVNVDERTNTLIIKDIPSVIHEATALVKAVDTQTPQVLIEAKIVEASLKFSRGLGAIWGVGWSSPTDSTGAVRPALFGAGDQTNNFLASNTISAATGLLNLGILGLDDKLQLDIQLQASEEGNQGKVISSPRVITLDNKAAVIKQGVAIKFTEATSDKLTTTFVDAVLQLKVTPHITANRSIIMKLGVSKNAPSLDSATGEINGINKNETNTEAILRDGETMVLGGIYVTDSGKGSTKVPFLADIPLLGAAFKSSTLKDERRELLVFVTPRIVTNPQADVE